MYLSFRRSFNFLPENACNSLHLLTIYQLLLTSFTVILTVSWNSILEQWNVTYLKLTRHLKGNQVKHLYIPPWKNEPFVLCLKLQKFWIKYFKLCCGDLIYRGKFQGYQLGKFKSTFNFPSKMMNFELNLRVGSDWSPDFQCITTCYRKLIVSMSILPFERNPHKQLSKLNTLIQQC